MGLSKKARAPPASLAHKGSRCGACRAALFEAASDVLCDFQDLTLGVKRGEAEADGPGFERSCGLVRKRRAVQARAHTDPLGCKPRGKRLAVPSAPRRG